MKEKVCFFCKKKKSLEEFALNKRRYDGRQTLCRACKADWDKNYYRRNKPKQLERVRRYRDLSRAKLFEYMKTHSCVDCGESNPVVLELDHVKGKKLGSISFLLFNQRSSWVKISKEIQKCEVRCANCHRIKTAKELKWYRFLEGN